MTYLLSQLLLCLALAALFGGAIGWLAHRARSSAQLQRLRDAHASVVRRLEEARGDARMLEDDFEELKRRSREEIEGLRAQNRALPELQSNLERGQQLMQQMRRRHESELRERVAERDALLAERAVLRERAAAHERTRQELEALRARLGSHAAGASAAATLAREDIDVLADRVIEIDDDLSAELSEAADGTATPERQPPAPPEGAAASAETDDGVASGADEGEEGHGTEDEYEDEPDHNSTLAVEVLADTGLTLPPPEERDEASDADAESPEKPLFGPVDRRDDLQRIGGIGPRTERALNRLGITTYSQLARLEREEIERIADALQIVPDRIERDDWVGSARRQLEDVLEEL